MGKKPTLIAYTVTDRGGEKAAIWTRIGAAWPFEIGNGFTLQLQAIPINGRIILCKPKGEDKDG